MSITERRSGDEIRADMEKLTAPCDCPWDGDHVICGKQEASSRLAFDASPLLAEVARLRGVVQAVERLTQIYERTAEVDPTGEFQRRVVDLRAALAAEGPPDAGASS